MTSASVPLPGQPRPRSEGEDPPALKRVITRNMLLLFVVGDMLGGGHLRARRRGRRARSAARSGPRSWSPLVLAAFTAGAYAELVTKYPQAAGAALYANKAFRKPFVTFMVAFAVMASGITSASTLARAFGGDYLGRVRRRPDRRRRARVHRSSSRRSTSAASPSRSSSTSALTLVELGGLLLIVVIGVAALGRRRRRRSAARSSSRRATAPSARSSAAPRSPSTR